MLDFCVDPNLKVQYHLKYQRLPCTGWSTLLDVWDGGMADFGSFQAWFSLPLLTCIEMVQCRVAPPTGGIGDTVGCVVSKLRTVTVPSVWRTEILKV